MVEDSKTAILIFDYLDYRSFLKDLTHSLKQSKQFNLRDFAKKADIKAPGYLKMVIDGRRKLSVTTALKFCIALNITGRAKDYFIMLVQYNQTTNPDLKKEFFDKLVSLKPKSAHYQLQKHHNRYFSALYHVIIREMVALKDFKEDHKWIAARCCPPITPAQAKEAIEILLELGMLQRDKNGKLTQTESFVHTEDLQTQMAEAYHFHEAVIDRARHALGQLSQKERNYYALSLPLPKKMYEEIIHDFYEFRDKIISKVSQMQKDYDEVYQLNFQLFPLTKKSEID